MSNNDQHTKFEEALKKALDSIEPAYNPGDWKELEKGLNRQPKGGNSNIWKKNFLNFIVIGSITVAASCFILFYATSNKNAATDKSQSISANNENSITDENQAVTVDSTRGTAITNEQVSTHAAETSSADQLEENALIANEERGDATTNTNSDNNASIVNGRNGTAPNASQSGSINTHKPLNTESRGNGPSNNARSGANNRTKSSVSVNNTPELVIDKPIGSSKGKITADAKTLSGSAISSSANSAEPNRKAAQNLSSVATKANGEKQFSANSAEPKKAPRAKTKSAREQQQAATTQSVAISKTKAAAHKNASLKETSGVNSKKPGRNETNSAKADVTTNTLNKKEQTTSPTDKNIKNNAAARGDSLIAHDSLKNANKSKELLAAATALDKKDSVATKKIIDSLVTQLPKAEAKPTSKENTADDITKNGISAASDNFLINFWENPGYTGAEGKHTFNARYKNQWLALEKMPANLIIGYDAAYGKNKNSGIGGYFINTMAGYSVKRIYGLSYSYKLTFKTKHAVHFGLAAAYNQKTVNWNSLSFGNMIDPAKGFTGYSKEPQTPTAVSYFDFNTGALYTYERFYFGFSALHLTQPNESYIKSSVSPVPRDFYITSGYKFILNSWSVSPSVDVKKTAGLYINYSPGLVVTYNDMIFVGSAYRNLNLFTLQAGIAFNTIRLTINTGIPTAKNLKTFGSVGIIEAGIRYQLRSSTKSESK